MVRILSLGYLIAFCIAIIGMAISAIFHFKVAEDDAFASAEQRPRSELHFSGWKAPEIDRYLSSVESYFADRLPFRTELLLLQAGFNKFFGKPLNTELLVRGSDGWLFFGNGAGRGIDQYRGIVQLSPQQLQAFTGYFQSVQSALKPLGIPLIVVIAPDKHSIYPEHLPAYLSRRGNSPLDQLNQTDLGFPLLDLRPSLLNQKKQTDLPLYFRTDSHWNEYGAYRSYLQVMEKLGFRAPFEAANSDFLRPAPQPSKADLAIKSGTGEVFLDEYTHLRRNFFSKDLNLEDFLSGTTSKLPANNKTRLSAMHSHRVSGSGHEGTLLVLGDSFTENMSPFFNHSFGNVVYQHYVEYGRNDIANMAAQYKANAVVFMMVERNLIIPVSRFIPATQSPHLQERQQASVSNTPSANPQRDSIVIANNRLIAESDLVRQISDVRLDKGDLVFRSTGFDPYFHLPAVSPLAKGAIVRLEITLPADRLVQLFYQTPQQPQITEEQSVRTPLPAGRHTIQWAIKSPLNGHFRLDPGNAPGDYRIHKIEIIP
jgi:hypothetical protein